MLEILAQHIFEFVIVIAVFIVAATLWLTRR